MKIASDIWIRVAGNAKRIKSGTDPLHWRCFVDRALPEIALSNWRLSGLATATNMVPGTDPTASNSLGLNAWFDCYGDLEVVDEVATITLK